MKRIAILQSNYIPWKGYFDIIASVDEFVVYDCAQYTKNDWRNRNQIKTSTGKAWLTVPVRQTRLGQTIEETEVADTRCFSRHWKTFRQFYSKSPHLKYCDDGLADLFLDPSPPSTLSDCNFQLICRICELIGIKTTLRRSSEFTISGDRNQKLVNLCKALDATEYLSGPAASTYLDADLFSQSGITVEWMDYAEYKEYPQPHPPFDHYVSILDLLAGTGSHAAEFMLHRSRQNNLKRIEAFR